MDDNENRRRSFRLDDTLNIWFRKISEETLEQITDDFEHYRLRYCLKSHFVFQREARAPAMQVLKKRNGDAALYIEHLERQIIKLAERLDSSVDAGEGRYSQRLDVNLSADGVRFLTDQDLQCDEYLELGLELPTNEVQLISIAKVVRSSVRSNGLRDLSLEYTLIHDEDIDAIIRHLAKLQQRQLQARRQG